MIKAFFLLATPFMLSACAARRIPVLDTPQSVFDHARIANWRVRAFIGNSTLEGRVELVGSERVRIGGVALATADIDSIHRSVEIDKGGKTTGAVLGGLVGVALGSLAVQFWEYGAERNCDGRCQFRIVAPTTLAISIIGMVTGAAIGPAEREWATVWKRP